MDVIQMTRELGKLIQQDERYKEYHTAKEINDNDTDLQEKIGEFNLKRIDLNNAMGKENTDQERLTALDAEIKSLYAEIMGNPNMALFNEAKKNMDNMLAEINMIITMSANGEDPATCVVEDTSCSGSCGSCSGC